MPRPSAPRHECLFGLALLFVVGCAAPEAPRDGWQQVGGMHAAIAAGQHHGRVALADLAGRPHVFGVGALPGLAGELTLVDSRVVATVVDDAGTARPAADVTQATLFVGDSVPAWRVVEQAGAVAADDLDATVGALAERLGRDVNRPLVFVVEGTFVDVDMHVLNGACPVHAGLNGLELSADQRPASWRGAALEGTLVGVHARDAAGVLTHRDTTIHAHLVFEDPALGAPITAHVERAGLAPGARFRFPADG